MNILILTPFYPPVISTLSNMVKELSHGLLNKGHNIIVCSTLACDRLSSDTIIKNNASIQVGAGIVADSDPELEWIETENKARSLLRAISIADDI